MPQAVTLKANHKWFGDEYYTDNVSKYYINGTLDSTTDPHSTRLRSFELGYKKGYSISGFQKLVRLGKLLPHTAYERFTAYGEQRYGLYAIHNSTGNADTVVKTNWSPGSWYSVNKRVMSPFYDDYVDLPNWALDQFEIDNNVDLSDKDYYIQQAAAAIASSGHDTLTFLAELTKVRRMFASRAGKLLNARSIEPNLKHKPGDWLESRYGWRTLIYDLQNLHDALTEFDSKRTRYSERRGFSQSWTVTDTDTVDNSVYNMPIYNVQHYETSVRGAVTADFMPDRFRFSPIGTAWELLPYSFIIDWFINVGQSLESITLLSVASDITSSYGYFAKVDQEVTGYPAPKGPQYSVSSKGSNQGIECVGEYQRMKRVPTRVSYNPQIKTRLDGFKILDLLALLVQRLI